MEQQLQKMEVKSVSYTAGVANKKFVPVGCLLIEMVQRYEGDWNNINEDQYRRDVQLIKQLLESIDIFKLYKEEDFLKRYYRYLVSKGKEESLTETPCLKELTC